MSSEESELEPVLGEEMEPLETSEPTTGQESQPAQTPPDLERLKLENTLLETKKELLKLQAQMALSGREAPVKEVPREEPPDYTSLDILKDVDDQTLESGGLRGASNILGERLLKIVANAVGKERAAVQEENKKLREEVQQLQTNVNYMAGDIVRTKARSKFADWDSVEPQIEAMLKENPHYRNLAIEDLYTLAEARRGKEAKPSNVSAGTKPGAGPVQRVRQPNPKELSHKPTGLAGEEAPTTYESTREAIRDADRELRSTVQSMGEQLARKLST